MPRWTAFAALACLLTACHGGLPGSQSAPGGAFDQNKLHETTLTMDPAEWRALRANYLTNQYYPADITIDGEKLPQVGVRSRGSGSRNEAKPGIKVDFNKYVKAQEFRGYKTLVIDNLIQDKSFLRERLSFAVFQAMDVAAPQSSFTRLTVNGEYWGLYQLTEPVSKPFLKERFGEEAGNLFDYRWVDYYYFTYPGNDPSLYVPIPFQPETNEDKLDPSGLIAFMNTINTAPDAAFASQISSFLDVDKFLTYVAVENAVSEYDGIVGEFGVNNFYIYQYKNSNRFVLIPWDKDTSFINSAWPLYSRMDQNVLTRRLMGDPGRRSYYANQVKKAVTSFVNDRWLKPRLELGYQQIRSAALADTKKPSSNGGFEDHVEILRLTIRGREADVLSQAP